MRLACLLMLAFTSVFLLSSCLTTKTIHLESKEGRLIEVSGPPIHKIGLLSDIHGHLDKLDGFLEQFKSEKVEAVIVSGDSVLNEELSYGRVDKIEDEAELEEVLNHLKTAGVPVFVIPGNHEGQGIYKRAWGVKRESVFDLVQYRFVDLKGLDLVSLPGYYIETDSTHRFLPADGFFLSKEGIQNLSILLRPKEDKDPVMVITHGPPLSSLETGFDVVQGVGHTGSSVLRKALLDNPISFAIFGHIHEGGPKAENSTDSILEGIFSDHLWVNVGAVQDGRASILEVSGNKASFTSISD
ncbi:MAG: metallophosphoesterase [Nanoarchaeota archaeon]